MYKQEYINILKTIPSTLQGSPLMVRHPNIIGRARAI